MESSLEFCSGGFGHEFQQVVDMEGDGVGIVDVLVEAVLARGGHDGAVQVESDSVVGGIGVLDFESPLGHGATVAVVEDTGEHVEGEDGVGFQPDAEGVFSVSAAGLEGLESGDAVDGITEGDALVVHAFGLAIVESAGACEHEAVIVS